MNCTRRMALGVMGALMACGATGAAQTATPAAAPAGGRPSWAEPLTTVEGVSEYRLPNGLRVLLVPDLGSVEINVQIAYFVGSRHEGRGEKGMAHLLEHMLFKGTPAEPEPNKSLKARGASSNATTWTDRTKYFESMLATDDNLDWVLRFEADRMQNAHIAAEDLAKEMTVVRNEFETAESDPFSLMLRGLMANAFTWHPYRNATIGNRSDIERVPAENLRRFYKHYYRPSNALLVLAGRFERPRALELIDKYFAPLQNPPEPIVDTWTQEPTQDGPRDFEIRRAGSQASVGLLYHMPPGSQRESSAGPLFTALLTDIPWGRMYRSVVQENLAAQVSVIPWGMAERGQLLVIATLNEGQDPDAALTRIRDVMEGFSAQPVDAQEIERARASVLRQLKEYTNNSGILGFGLTDAAAIGDWRLFFIQRDWIKTMTAADVQAVAVKYFVPDNRTAGKFIPTEAPQRAEVPPVADVAALVRDYRGTETVSEGELFDPTPENIEARTVRTKLAENIELARMPRKSRGDKIHIVMTIRYGTEPTLAGRKVAHELLGWTMYRGSVAHDFQDTSDLLDNTQSDLSISSEPGVLRVTITSDRQNYVRIIDQARDLLRDPAFPEAEFRTLHGNRLATLESQLSEPQALADAAAQRALAPFPPESFHYLPTLEERVAEYRATGTPELRKLYRELVSPTSVQIGVVGDFDAAELEPALRAVFEGWPMHGPYERVVRPFVEISAGSQVIRTPDKPNAIVCMATALPMSDDDPDAAAMQIACYILGTSSNSRLANRLRDRDGLSYDAYAVRRTSAVSNLTTLIAFASCAKENADKALSAMREELRRWIDAGISDTELVEAKSGYRQAVLGNTTDAGIAQALASDLFLSRTRKWTADRLAAIDALTVAQVNDTLRRRLGAAKFVELRVGDLPAAASDTPANADKAASTN